MVTEVLPRCAVPHAAAPGHFMGCVLRGRVGGRSVPPTLPWQLSQGALRSLPGVCLHARRLPPAGGGRCCGAPRGVTLARGAGCAAACSTLQCPTCAWPPPVPPPWSSRTWRTCGGSTCNRAPHLHCQNTFCVLDTLGTHRYGASQRAAPRRTASTAMRPCGAGRLTSAGTRPRRICPWRARQCPPAGQWWWSGCRWP